MGDPETKITPKRDAHEQKPGAKSTVHHPKTRVGAANREWLIRTDMQEAVKLTGQWRHDGHRYHLFINQAGPHIQMLLALVESGASGNDDDVPRDKVRIETRVVRLGGTVDASDRTLYHLYLQHPNDPVTADLACGSLQHFNSGKRLRLELDLSGIGGQAPILSRLAKLKSTVAIRFGQGVNLFENHIGQRWISAEIRSQQWFPLTPKQIARLPSFIFGARIKAREDNYLRDVGGPLKSFGYVDLLRAYYMTAQDKSLSDTQKRLRLGNAAAVLDLLVRGAYWDALRVAPEHGGIDIFHKDHFRIATLDSLANDSITVAGQDTPHSLLTHTQAILDGSHESLSLKNFEELLHLQRRFGGHYYAAEIELVDADGSPHDVKKLEKTLKKFGFKYAQRIAKALKRRIPAGGLFGALRIKKQDDPDENPEADKKKPEWEGLYVVAFAGLNLSRGTGPVLIQSKGHAKHVYGRPWQPEQLEGMAVFGDLGASIFGGGAGKGASLTGLGCRGSGGGRPPTPLMLNFSGISDVFSARVGTGAAFSGFGGWIWYEKSVSHDKEIEAPPKNAPFMYGSQSAAGPLHFRINQGGLREDGEHLLQAFAATELAVLGHKGVSLTIEGYADQPDNDFNNMILSRNRAISTFNYLKNILGKDLPIPDLEIPPSEAEEKDEEKKAKAKAEKYKVFMPEDTQQIVIEAHGESKAKPKDNTEDQKKNSKPEYNQEFRRVDLSINGVVRLGLRRKDDGPGSE